MRRYRRGLVVGKFAPLHAGHVLLIDAARAACEEVVILSYSNPEFELAPPAAREHWLAELFPECVRWVVTPERVAHWFPHDPPPVPDNEASETEHRAFVALLLERVVRRQVDAVFTSEDYGAGFALHLSRAFSATVAHVEVDRARTRAAISGSALRRDLWRHWRHLPAAVAVTLVQRVVFLGGESSGKSTLALAMAAAFETQSVSEYGRELWMQKDGRLEFDDFSVIAREQIRREDAAGAHARRFTFCDTSPLTTLFYCREQYGRAAAELEAAARRPYDHVVLCAPDFPFVQDGTRRDSSFRERQHRWYAAELDARGVAYMLATGTFERRVATLTDRLATAPEAPWTR